MASNIVILQLLPWFCLFHTFQSPSISTSMTYLVLLPLVLKPLSAEAKATLTTKPGQDPNIPQANVGIVVNEVAVHVDEWQVSTTLLNACMLQIVNVNFIL